MQNSPVHAKRRWCRFSDRRGFMLPTVAHTGSGAEFSDRLSLVREMANLAYCCVASPLTVLSAARTGAARMLASGDRAVHGIDLSADLLIWQYPDGLDPKRQSGRDKHLGFPKWIRKIHLDSFA